MQQQNQQILNVFDDTEPTTIPVITQTKMRERFPTAYMTCVDCTARQEILIDDTHKPRCMNCKSFQLMDAGEYIKRERAKYFNQLTLQDWIDLLPSLIKIQQQKGNKNTARVLNIKLRLLRATVGEHQ